MYVNSKAIRNKTVRDKDRDRETNYVLRWAKRWKALVYKGMKCSTCGNSDFRVLSFHHPGAKNIDLGRTDARWEEIRREIDQCILVCENCHRELHDSGERDARQKQNKELCLNNRKETRYEEITLDLFVYLPGSTCKVSVTRRTSENSEG